MTQVEKLSGKSAAVTGGASGYGLAITKRFFEEGANIVIVDVSPNADQVAKEIDPSGTRVIATRADVREESEVAAAFKLCVDTFGSLDVAVNNAGVLGGGWMHEDDASEHYHRSLAINLTGVWNSCRSAVLIMREQRQGVILNTASTAAIMETPGSPAYGLGKAAVVHLTRSLSFAYGRDGIRVNCVLPGPAATAIFGMDAAQMAELEKGYIPKVSLGRMAKTSDVASAMAYLASEDASFISGAILTVDGGFQPGPSPVNPNPK